MSEVLNDGKLFTIVCGVCPECREVIKNVKLYDKVYNDNGVGSKSKTICPNCGKEITLEDPFDILPELKAMHSITRGED